MTPKIASRGEGRSPLFSYGRTYAFNGELDMPVTPDELAHFYLAKWK